MTKTDTLDIVIGTACVIGILFLVVWGIYLMASVPAL